MYYEAIVKKRLVAHFLLTMNEVALLLPDEEGIAQSRKDETGQDLAGTGASTEKAEAVGQQKHPQAEDGQAFD